MRSDRILVKGIAGHGFHGVFAEERRTGQLFTVDLALEVDTFQAATTDSIEEAVDYSEVINQVHQIITGEPYNLIEALAERIAADLLNSYELITALEVVVHKPQAPVGVIVSDIAAEIYRRR